MTGSESQKRSIAARRRAAVDPIDVSVGIRIREERLRQGVTQTGLARGIGVTFQQVQKYERGINRISASMLVRIAKALNVPVSAVFPADIANDLPALDSSTLGRELQSLVAEMSPDLQALILSIAKAFRPT